MNRWDAPFGSFDVEVGDAGISAVKLANGDSLPSFDDDYVEHLDDHVHGRPAALKLDLQGVRPLAQLTLAKLLEIPYAEVRSYAWVAREIGRPAAVRSVASAVADNPLPVLIPCHRVIRSDGQLGDYSLGGAEMKKRLLSFEGMDLERLDKLASRGVRYLVSDDGKFHLPSCHQASEADSELRTLDEARHAHHQPCRRCKP